MEEQQHTFRYSPVLIKDIFEDLILNIKIIKKINNGNN